MPESSKWERKLHLQEEIKTFYKHPEEGSKMEVSEDNLTGTQHLEGQGGVWTLDQCLEIQNMTIKIIQNSQESDLNASCENPWNVSKYKCYEKANMYLMPQAM